MTRLQAEARTGWNPLQLLLFDRKYHVTVLNRAQGPGTVVFCYLPFLCLTDLYLLTHALPYHSFPCKCIFHNRSSSSHESSTCLPDTTLIPVPQQTLIAVCYFFAAGGWHLMGLPSIDIVANTKTSEIINHVFGSQIQ